MKVTKKMLEESNDRYKKEYDNLLNDIDILNNKIRALESIIHLYSKSEYLIEASKVSIDALAHILTDSKIRR